MGFQTLNLYTTLGCHLCEAAEAVVRPLLDEYTLKLIKIDIADNDSLVEQYGVRIPVIRFGDAQVDLGWPFNEADVRAYVAHAAEQIAASNR